MATKTTKANGRKFAYFAHLAEEKDSTQRREVIVAQDAIQMLNICSDICFDFEGRAGSQK